jgi:hypothetical protein
MSKFVLKIPVLLLRLIFVLALIPFGLGLFVFFPNDANPPGADEAPWAVQTYIRSGGQLIAGRVYYGREFSSQEGEPAISGYWAFDGKGYDYHRGEIVFDEDLWGRVDIIKRQGGN